jgi:hypothetical protein
LLYRMVGKPERQLFCSSPSSYKRTRLHSQHSAWSLVPMP